MQDWILGPSNQHHRPLAFLGGEVLKHHLSANPSNTRPLTLSITKDLALSQTSHGQTAG